MSGSINAQVENWSKIEAGVTVTKVDPNANTIDLSNGKQFNYKALVFAPGFDHQSEYIKGLPDLEAEPDSENTFVHMVDDQKRTHRNFWNGWNNFMGDLLCYSPAYPYKGEGTDFYACYYEHFLRRDKLQGRAHPGARVQYWTPNKSIFQFDYANEVALDECHKRGIEVHFGWEMVEVKRNSSNQKVAVFRNVDTNELIEKDFFTGCINPTSKPVSVIAEAGLGDANGLMDVNKYTLQHNKYENVFSFGDAVGFETTRTHNAAIAQNPVIKNNLIRFMQGKELNGVYDGYSYQPFLLGDNHATNFSHLHDFEPAPLNHTIPHYGFLTNRYFGRYIKMVTNQDSSYSGFTKNHGPFMNGYVSKEYDEPEHNEYLQEKGLDPQVLVHPSKRQLAPQ